MSLLTIVSLTTVAPSAIENGSNGTYRITSNHNIDSLIVKLKIDHKNSVNDGSTTINGNEIIVVVSSEQNFVEMSLIATDERLKLNLEQELLYLRNGANNTSTITISRNNTVVIKNNDFGEGSLQQAVENTNVFMGAETISFTSVSADLPDTINANSSNDILTGNGGDDVLVGGTGDDILTGGLGADHFLYQTTSDRTTDLNSNQDLLDLTGLFDDSSYSRKNFVTSGYLQFLGSSVNTLVQIDLDDINSTQGFSTLVI